MRTDAERGRIYLPLSELKKFNVREEEILKSEYSDRFFALAAGVAPPLFALAQFDGWWRAVAMLALLQIINFIVGNIVYPRLQGRNLNMDPVAILLALAFWGAIWGLPGMFLSTPLTVMAMVVLAQFKSTHWVAVMLSSDGNPLGAHRSPGRDPAPAGEVESVI